MANKAIEVEERYSFYDEMARVYEQTGSAEALVAEALKDEELCEWLLGKGATAVIQDLRANARVRAVIEVTAIRREASERGKKAALAPNRTRRLQHAIFDWPLWDGSRLGDATVEKLEHQGEYHRRMAEGNQRMWTAFDTLAKKLRASGKKKLIDAVEGEDVAKLIARVKAIKG